MGRFLSTAVLFASLATSAGLTGCTRSTEKLNSSTKTFNLKGRIISVDAEHNQVMIQHEAIPGFMEAMTMPYRMAYVESLKELHEGDMIRARLLVDKMGEGDYRFARLDQVAILGQAHPNFKPATNYNVPTAGQPIPDFHMTDQDGKSIHLAQFQGKALLITFIYTRCPLGDFCPKMSRDFAEVAKALQAAPAVYAKTDMLSISFDPVYDTPQVLEAYGKEYTGTNGFQHWQFAAPAKADLTAVEHFFNVGDTPGENSTINHSLSTVLIDPAGKIAAWYPGNEWNPAEVAAKMTSLVQQPAGAAR